MAGNTFGSVSSGGADVFDLFDPRLIRSARAARLRNDIPELRYANSLYISNGMFPARAWFLMRRGDFVRIDPYSTTLQLNITDLGANPAGLTFKNLTVVQARCVSRGIAADPNSLYL